MIVWNFENHLAFLLKSGLLIDVLQLYPRYWNIVGGILWQSATGALVRSGADVYD